MRAEVERIEREEAVLLDAWRKAWHDAAFTEAQLAECMGAQAPAAEPLERSLATCKHSPSVTTLRKYGEACGKKLVIQVA